MRRGINKGLLVVGAGLCALSAGFVVACGGDDDDEATAEVTAVATTTQIADFVGNIGGDRVQVEQLLDADVDPHDYEPVPSDARNLAEADIIFRAGFDLDEWLDELIENAGGDATVVDTSAGIETVTLEEDGVEEEDPHIWFDPANVLLIVDNIVAGLVEVDPEGEATYQDNGQRYKEEVRGIDADVEQIFSACEPSELKLVTNHDSLGYLARRYNLTIVGAVIPSLETTAEPSAEDLASLIELIDEEQVQAIFSESSVDTEVEDQVAEESGAEVVAELYTDTLSPEDSEAATYLEMMVYNARTIVDELGCAE